MNIEDIPSIPDCEKRFQVITVDCYEEHEVLSAFEVYLTDALHTPFAATWRDEDEPGRVEPVTVLGVADVDDRRGVLMQVRRANGRERRVLAEQLWLTTSAARMRSCWMTTAPTSRVVVYRSTSMMRNDL
jgi:hypothetical protein